MDMTRLRHVQNGGVYHAEQDRDRQVDETLLREAADDVARRDKYLHEDDGDGTLPIGQRVRHAVFGEGTVLDVDLNKGAHVIQFDGMGTPRSISLRAKLEKIGP